MTTNRDTQEPSTVTARIKALLLLVSANGGDTITTLEILKGLQISTVAENRRSMTKTIAALRRRGWLVGIEGRQGISKILPEGIMRNHLPAKRAIGKTPELLAMQQQAETEASKLWLAVDIITENWRRNREQRE
jgi:hypothetical protein